jgi:hypothetical protein
MDIQRIGVGCPRGEFSQKGFDSILESEEVIIFILIPLEIPQPVFGVEGEVDVKGEFSENVSAARG